MNASLFDFSPLAQLLLLGAALAAVPLLWLLWRHRGASLPRRRLALVSLTLFLTFDLVLVGAFTRLSDSGLGCPDWPGCYSHASPLGAKTQIAAEQAVRPDGPVTHRKAWIEMIHRYLATAVGALIAWTAVQSWRDGRRGGGAGGVGASAAAGDGQPAFWLPALTLAWVCIQGLFGALTVTMKLQPLIVTLHLMGGYALIVLLVLQVLAWSRAAGGTRVPAPGLPAPANLRIAILAALALLGLQAASGAWVSTNYAVLACSDFPTCQGRWWPSADWSGFQLWRPLGARADGQSLDAQALVTIHQAHRALALCTVLALLALWQVLRDVPAVARARRWLIALLGLQVLTGVSNVILGWPLLAAVLHTGGAGALVAVLVWIAAELPVASVRGPSTGWQGARA